MLNKNFQKHYDDGFSLIELAIVLLVIGLIVGGILKGQELIESARLRSLISQIQDYRTATSIFMEKYGSYPGDYNMATETIDAKLINGDNNGIISSGTGAYDESLSYWQHLAAADLIASSDIPTTKLGGLVTIHYGDFGTPRHWFVVGAKNGNDNNGGLLTPAQAMNIDRKIDTGDPTSGHLRAKDGVGSNNGKCVNGKLYDLTNTKPACVVYFML